MVFQLYPDEQIVLELRRHWFIFFLETVFVVVLVFVPIMTLVVLSRSGITDTNPIIGDLFVLASLTWYLFSWIVFFVLWTNFYLDAWIITDKRIIDIEQYALFNREVSEFRVDNIQDVTINIDGFIPTMLGFGDILIETAGEQKHCTIKDAPDPEKVKNLVSRLQSESGSRKV